MFYVHVLRSLFHVHLVLVLTEKCNCRCTIYHVFLSPAFMEEHMNKSNITFQNFSNACTYLLSFRCLGNSTEHQR